MNLISISSRLLKSGVLFAVACTWLPVAHAATVQFKPGSSTVATGISGLDVSGTVYNVDFIGTVRHNEWPSMLDVTTKPEATSVILAIGTAFENAGVTSVEYDTVGGGTFDLASATLWYGTNSTQLLGVNINPNNLGGWTGFVGDSTAPLNNAYPFSVDLTVASVPVPAAVWLFGSGLLGLVGISRRK